MWNLGYWYIFTCAIDLEGYLFDPNNGMLQIAAYLQHIYCKWQFLKNYEFSQDETQDIVSLESNYTSYQISWCCSNQKCCSNMLQQPEVQQQLAAKLLKCETYVTDIFLHALLIWKATSLIRTTVCCKLQHICSTSIANGYFSKIMNSVEMKLRI